MSIRVVQRLQRKEKKLRLSRELKTHVIMQQIIIYNSRHFNLSKRCSVNVLPVTLQQAAAFELHT